ncbi:MAG: PHP domain-containing protein [Treponemataceae bacterium]|nr:PHP domain-containing protein [Treponemataceae bacterium]
MVDLHVHSRASDGSASFLHIVQEAARQGLTAFALTDHEYTGHLDQAQALRALLEKSQKREETQGEKILSQSVPLISSKADVMLSYTLPRLIGGVEVSCRGAHILGYYLTSHTPALNSLCSSTLALRHQMTLDALEAFRSYGVPIDRADVETVAYEEVSYGALDSMEGIDWSVIDRPPVLYRQHLLEAVRKLFLHGERYYDRTFDEVCRLVYEDGAFIIPDTQYPDPRDVVRAIIEDGGCAVLAHPGLTKNWDTVSSLVDVGLWGIEGHHPRHTSEDCDRVRFLCEHFHLAITGGSDWHGRYDEQRPTDTYYVNPLSLCPEKFQIYFSHPLGRELLFGEQMVHQAGNWLRTQRSLGSYGSHPIAHKNGDHRNLVSVYDHQVEACIRSRVSCLFPQDLVIGEEVTSSYPQPGQRVWLVDPIDGTTNFIRWGREYTVSLALYQNQQPLFGLVYDVAADKLYRGIAGERNYCNGEPLKQFCHMVVAQTNEEQGEIETENLSPDQKEPLKNNPLCTAIIDASLNTLLTFARRGIDIQRWHNQLQAHRSTGCASLAIVRIALGELDGYLSDRLYPWDWAAASIMLTNEGGFCSGLFGCSLTPYGVQPCPFIAVRSPLVAKALLGSLWLSSN